MSDAPQWDGKIYRPAKPGEGSAGIQPMVLKDRYRVHAGVEATPQRRREEERYSVRDADELDRLQWAVTPSLTQVIVCIVEGLLWPFKMLGRVRE
jgi:hypothetical protein